MFGDIQRRFGTSEKSCRQYMLDNPMRCYDSFYSTRCCDTCDRLDTGVKGILLFTYKHNDVFKDFKSSARQIQATYIYSELKISFSLPVRRQYASMKFRKEKNMFCLLVSNPGPYFQ